MSRYKDPTLPDRYLMDQVNCKSTETSLWECPHVTPDNNQCKEESFGFVAVECSGNVTLSLNMNGQRDKCAGVVQFSTKNVTKNVIGVCNSQWDEQKANKVCQELNCGKHYYIPKPGIFEVQQNTHMGLLECVREERFLWQCVDWPRTCEHQASVICTKHRRFRLQGGGDLCSGLVEVHDVSKNSWVPFQQKNVPAETICTQLNCGTSGNVTTNITTNSPQLTCSGKVKLVNFRSKCFGTVYVNINGSERGVCYSNTRSRELGKVVCRELGCDEVLDVKRGARIQNGWLSNVECQGDEASLWHCLANHSHTACESTTVICAGSLDVHLSDGLGKCSGRVEVKLEDSWRSFSSKDWTTENSDVVCTHLGCGKSTEMTREVFVEGNVQQMVKDWEVKCNSSTVKFKECVHKIPLKADDASGNQRTKQIICQKEELRFFEGDWPCRGRVRIKPFDGESRWLAVENNKTASAVCEAMQCGSLESYQREENSSHAHVNCSGSVNVSLLNPHGDRCWGSVYVCRGRTCGGVCGKTWRQKDSKMLCENLGCGDPINSQLPLEPQSNLQVLDYSVYCLEEVKNMSMCNFISINKFSCKVPASVICSGSIKAKLEDPRDKCAGKVQLFYAGRWTPVCRDSLTLNFQNAVCRELNCGRAESIADALYGEPQTTGLSQLDCSEDADSVQKCRHSGMSTKMCTIGYLKCSEWRRLLLYKKKDTCSGPVYALRAGQTPLHVSSQGWSDKELQVLCQYLQCGNYKNHSSKEVQTPSEWWNKTYNCLGKNNIWDCESDRQPTELKNQLNITCDGKNLTLSNQCTGDVFINKERVCAWDENMSHELCDSLECGKAIDYWQRAVSSKTEGWHFSCTGRETSLLQCGSKRVSCNSIMSVACQKAVQFKTTQKCGGSLAVKFRGEWEYVCGDLNEHDAKKVCAVLNCKNDQTQLDESEINPKKVKKKQVVIKCSNPSNQMISQCVQLLEEGKCKPAQITCDGYIPEKSSSGPSILEVGLPLGILGVLVLIIILQRKRILSALRRHRNKDVNLNGNEMNNMETVDRDSSERRMSSFEEDDYTDVDAAIKNTKIGENGTDNTRKGSSGTEYDDVEEEANGVSRPQTHADDDRTLPLLPKRPENLLDEVTYEVEIEPQEDYDDVMSGESLANENTEIPMTDTADITTDPGANINIAAVETEVQAQPE